MSPFDREEHHNRVAFSDHGVDNDFAIWRQGLGLRQNLPSSLIASHCSRAMVNVVCGTCVHSYRCI
jgi:hypothetical protein